MDGLEDRRIMGSWMDGLVGEGTDYLNVKCKRHGDSGVAVVTSRISI
jgi:hypothetical protein